MRSLILVALVGCAAAKPIIGVEPVKGVNHGSAVLADGDVRWGAYLQAQEPAIVAALAEADHVTPGPRPPGPGVQTGPTASIDASPRYLPDEQRFEIRYTYTRTILQQWSIMSSCGKYRNYFPTPEPQVQPEEMPPQPMPCPAPIPVPQQRQFAATVGLVLEYRADGSFIAAHPTPAAPVLPKTTPPKP